jgi:choline-sulfatase
MRAGGDGGLAGRDFVVAGDHRPGPPGGQVHGEYGPVRMVRAREWKYVHRYPYGPHELYDLGDDPEERADLIDDPGRRAIREELKAELDAWFVRPPRPARAAPGRGRAPVGHTN